MAGPVANPQYYRATSVEEAAAPPAQVGGGGTSGGGAGGGGGFLAGLKEEAKRIPMWGWVAIGLVAILLVRAWLANRAGGQSPGLPPGDTTSAGTANAPTSGDGGKKGSQRTYTVQSGDTLVAIGHKFGVDWHSIYEANAALIEATARQHGFSSSDGGHWIFPGEVLVIPS